MVSEDCRLVPRRVVNLVKKCVGRVGIRQGTPSVGPAGIGEVLIDIFSRSRHLAFLERN